MKKAIFPGSFDPFTAGHKSIVLRASKLFDKIIIAVGYNSEKKGLLKVENRIKLIEDIFRGNEQIIVKKYNKLTVDFCKEENVKFILRGLRNSADFEYENTVAQMNRFLDDGIETYFLLSEPEHAPVSSSLVREVLRYNGDVSKFMPEEIDIKNYL